MTHSTKRALWGLGRIIIAVIILIVFLSPFVFMLGASFRLDRHIFANISPISLRTFVPRLSELTLDNFVGIFHFMTFGRALAHSLLVGICMTSSVLILNSLAAFAFSRIAFPFKKVLFFALLSTMLLPVEVGMIPMYNVVRNLGFHNTFAALVIPWIGEPFAMFMLKQFFDGIPRTLDEAAIIDGCSWFGVFRHVVIPNSKSILVTLALMQFLMSWDGFFWPLIAVESEALTVVQVAVSSMLDPDYIRWGWTFAAASVATVPILALFLAFQRYYVEGISSTGIKE